MLARPCRDAQSQAEGSRFLGVERYFNPSLVRIIRLLGNREARASYVNFRGGFRIHCEVEVFIIVGVGHSLNLGKQAGHVARATGGSEPRSSSGRSMVERVLSVRLQGIDVEEPVTLEVDRGENVVEEGNLGHVEILGILVDQKHPEIKKHVANSGAGLVKGVGIGEKVGRSESLDSMNRSETTGDVHAGIRYVAPDPVQGPGV